MPGEIDEIIFQKVFLIFSGGSLLIIPLHGCSFVQGLNDATKLNLFLFNSKENWEKLKLWRIVMLPGVTCEINFSFIFCAKDMGILCSICYSRWLLHCQIAHLLQVFYISIELWCQALSDL